MARSAYITAVGTALPKQVLSNEQLLASMPWLDTSPDWIREHTGIRTRHVADANEHVTDLGMRAACKAFEDADISAADTDMVILATNTSQFVYPAGAAIIQGELAKNGRAMPKAASLDVQQGCASLMASTILAASMVQSGSCDQVLVIGADVATRMVDWTDRNCMLLGDGAAACVITHQKPDANRATPGLEILGSFMKTVPDHEAIHQFSGLDARNHPLQHGEHAKTRTGRITRETLYQRLGDAPESGANQHFRMMGRQVYRFVRRTVPGTGFFDVLHRASLISDDEFAQIQSHGRRVPAELHAAISSRIDRFIPHGANLSLVQELAEQLHIPYERMAVTLQEHGNTSAASVGITLDRILRGSTSYETVGKRDGEGRLTKGSEQVVVAPLERGHNVMLLSFGAGTSWNYIAARTV
tara:strand:- start:134523 stop:135767 length:1245 start_codon:yes stop_codon:yes gene_type:complete